MNFEVLVIIVFLFNVGKQQERNLLLYCVFAGKCLKSTYYWVIIS